MNYDFKPYPHEAKKYAAWVPAAEAAAQIERHPVIIAGGGPVGLAIALGLARHGVRSIVLEADDGVCTGSRAICISRRSLEIIARLGAVDGFLEKGLPWTGGRSFYRDAEVLHFTMPHDQDQQYPPMVNLAQYHIEQFLLEAAEKQAGLIEIRWQNSLTGVQQHGNGATLSVATPDGDYVMEAGWLVAADGGRSFVREALGLALKGTSYEGRYVIVDILLNSSRPAERLAYFDPPSNPGSTVLVHKQPDNVWRIDYQLQEDEDAEQAVRPENVIPRVQSLLEMMGESSDWSPVWITVYKAHALTLDQYRHGRVLFAGDAAHLVPIFGVRGANSGIDDADNLAWKLASAVKGLAADDLLDTYSQERVQAAHENLRQGIKSTEFMAPPSFAFELMRTAVLGLAERHPAVRPLINPRQTSAIRYLDSALNVDVADEAGFDAGPPPGATLPEAPLSVVDGDMQEETYVTRLLGPWITLLYFDRDGTLPAAATALTNELVRTGIQARFIPVAQTRPAGEGYTAWDHTGRLFPLFGAAVGTLYLVRPDGHVMARWRQFNPAQVLSAVRRAFPALAAEGDHS
ncbi:FAD-dependent oxidoreductase [Undibacterium sp. TJN25]|uniref:FAD-dependent oxidoreductase n=1 Tax=Undibacterium sp. TJN25 TaxID=3413056 RepID=UPI003BF2B789